MFLKYSIVGVQLPHSHKGGTKVEIALADPNFKRQNAQQAMEDHCTKTSIVY